MRKYLAPLMALAAISALAGCGNSHAATPENRPATMIGNWHQTSGNPGAVMFAEITPGAIQIDMQTRDSTNIYWLGTFDTDQSTQSDFTTISLADQDAMSNMIFASQDPTKKFAYKGGDLSFEFTMLGVTTTVHLSK